MLAELKFEHLMELFVGFGKRGKSAEHVAAGVAKQVKSYLKSSAPVGEYLADQLLLPLGISAHQGHGGVFRTGPLSGHATTHIEVLKRFLEVELDVANSDDASIVIGVTPSI